MEPQATERARQRLLDIKSRPGMFAACRESLVVQACTALWVAGAQFNASDFSVKHLKTQGCADVDLLDPIEESWASTVIDDALDLLNLQVKK